MHVRVRIPIMTAVAALMATTGAVVLGSGPAAAAGNPTLDHAIVVSAPPGWVATPASSLSARETQDMEQSSALYHGTYTEEAKLGTRPTSTNRFVAELGNYP